MFSAQITHSLISIGAATSRTPWKSMLGKTARCACGGGGGADNQMSYRRRTIGQYVIGHIPYLFDDDTTIIKFEVIYQGKIENGRICMGREQWR